MSKIVTPGRGLLYMKVGTHAKESLEEIVKRKTKEIEEAGFAFWGYGGGTCHPETRVQPFAKAYEQKGATIYLCMEEMNSRHFAEQIRAEEFSIDGRSWKTMPDPINVLGSRYALVLKTLQKTDFNLALHQTKVTLGNSMGALGSKYIKGRVDKACLEVTPPDDAGSSVDDKMVKIGLVAELADPYAVYVRNKPH